MHSIRIPSCEYPGSVLINVSNRQVAANLFVLSEVLRIFRVPPFGMLLQRFMEQFIDRRDQGAAVLTHVYLLLGCAIPIWCDVVLRAVSHQAGKLRQTASAQQPTLLPFAGLVSSVQHNLTRSRLRMCVPVVIVHHCCLALVVMVDTALRCSFPLACWTH